MVKRTKIVATISDRRCDVEFLQRLYDAGMNVVRLNTAHQSPSDSIKLIENVRKVSNKIAILVDTKGPEIRTTPMASGTGFDVVAGDKVYVAGNPAGLSSRDCLYLSYPGIVPDVPVGSTILIDDGDIAMEVMSKNSDSLVCEVKNHGTIKGRKSVNIPGVSIQLPSLSDKDIDFVHFAIEQKIDFIAHSFVRKKEDLMGIQKILDERKSPIRLIAKIENQEGVDNIEEILDHAYGIMVARGDLGIEIPAEKIPVIQRRLIRKCTESKKPVIIATQMLHTMITNPRPTRAEVSDIANAIYQRTDAIMLSGETAYGEYPEESVHVMATVAKEIESQLQPDAVINFNRIKNEVTAVLAKSAVKATSQLPIKAVVVDTLSGRTGRYLAAYRGLIPVYAMCYKEHVMRHLALSYGVQSFYMEPRLTKDEFVREAMRTLLENNKVQPDDLVLVVGGSFGHSNGATFMEISKVSSMLHFGQL